MNRLPTPFGDPKERDSFRLHFTPTFVFEEIPVGMVEFVRSKCRAERIVEGVLQTAAQKILRRLRHDTPDARGARWTRWWHPENQDRTTRWLSMVCDRELRQDHLVQVCTHDVHAQLPDYLNVIEVDETGALVVNDPQEITPSFGAQAFLEATPPEVPRSVHLWWHEQFTADLGSSLRLTLKPKVWDLTAGSGTGLDYFGCLHKCEVVSSDLTVADWRTIMADCRDIGLLDQHGRKRALLKGVKPSVVVATPDIILFDPSAPGFPLHSEVYGDAPHPKDFGLLDREHWIFMVADIAVRAMRLLADRGVVSLLLRCGFRLDGEAVADPTVLDDFKTVLGDRATIAHEIPVAYRNVRNQTSLGTARLPAVHLTLTRPK